MNLPFSVFAVVASAAFITYITARTAVDTARVTWRSAWKEAERENKAR